MDDPISALQELIQRGLIGDDASRLDQSFQRVQGMRKPADIMSTSDPNVLNNERMQAAAAKVQQRESPMASFGSLVPGMMPMAMPQMKQNGLLQQGMAILNASRQPQRGAAPNGQPQPGMLQRFLNPQAPPTDLAAPGMPPNSVPGPGGPMQMGLLAKLFPQLMGGMGGGAAPAAPPMPQPMAPPNAIGDIY